MVRKGTSPSSISKNNFNSALCVLFDTSLSCPTYNHKMAIIKIRLHHNLNEKFKAPQCKLNKHFNVIKAIVSFHSHGHKVSMLAVTKWRPDTGIANPKVCTMKAHGHRWQKLKKASQITMSKQFPKPYPMSVLTWSINNHPNVIEIQVTQPLRYHNS